MSNLQPHSCLARVQVRWELYCTVLYCTVASTLHPHSCLARVQVWWELPPATVGAWATTLQQTCKKTIKHDHSSCQPSFPKFSQFKHLFPMLTYI